MKMKLLASTKVFPHAKAGDVLDFDDLATAHDLERTGAAKALEALPPLKRDRKEKRPDVPDGPAMMKLLHETAVCPGKKPGDVVRIDDPATVRYFRRNNIAALIEHPPQAAMKGPPARTAAEPEAKGRKANAEPDPDNAAGG